MYRQILIIIVLLILSIGLYILTLKDETKIEPIKIAKIVIPKKSIRFKITKNQDNQINFRGTFLDENSPKEIITSLNRYRVIDNIKIDKKLESSRDIIIFIEKVLKRLDSSFLEWTILYKDRKLLVSGKTTDINSKNSIDSLINFSNLNCFSDIEVIQVKDNPLEILSNLKSVIKDEEMESKNSTTPTDDEVEDIILALKKIKPKKFIKNKNIKKEIKRSKNRIKKVVIKRKIKREKVIITQKIKREKETKKEQIILKSSKKIEKLEKIKEKETIFNKIETKKRVKKEITIEPAKVIPISYSEYKSLPNIQPIDNIEEFNKKLINSKKPIINRGTIYIDK